MATDASNTAFAALPEDVSPLCLRKRFSSLVEKRAMGLFLEGYVHNFNLCQVDDGSIIFRCKSFRWMARSKPPRKIFLQFGPGLTALLTDAHCSCKAGYTFTFDNEYTNESKTYLLQVHALYPMV
jgi:hypothetical protein